MIEKIISVVILMFILGTVLAVILNRSVEAWMNRSNGKDTAADRVVMWLDVIGGVGALVYAVSVLVR